jgi:hypothetical protein
MDYRFDSVLTACTVGIAGAMGLPDEQIKGIARGAAIHDVGQVPALCNILSQPEDLLPDELALFCTLSHDIHEMLRPVPFLADASEIVYAYRKVSMVPVTLAARKVTKFRWEREFSQLPFLRLRSPLGGLRAPFVFIAR